MSTPCAKCQERKLLHSVSWAVKYYAFWKQVFKARRAQSHLKQDHQLVMVSPVYLKDWVIHPGIGSQNLMSSSAQRGIQIHANWNVPHAGNIWVYIAIQGGRLSISLEEHKRKQLCNFFLAVGSSLFLSLLSVLVIYFIHKCKCQLQWKEWCLLWMLCRTEQPVHDLWGDQTCHYVWGILRTGKLRKPLGKFRNKKKLFLDPSQAET